MKIPTIITSILAFSILSNCSNSPYVVVYLSNINENVELAEFSVEIDGEPTFHKIIAYSNIRPSFEELFTRVSKGDHEIIFKVENTTSKMKFTHRGRIFFYASFIDSSDTSKIVVRKSTEPFIHE